MSKGKPIKVNMGMIKAPPGPGRFEGGRSRGRHKESLEDEVGAETKATEVVEEETEAAEVVEEEAEDGCVDREGQLMVVNLAEVDGMFKKSKSLTKKKMMVKSLR